MQKRNSGKITYFLFVAALGMCIYGAASGEAEAVLAKAIHICLECIGIG